jgi:hypothetical protein
LIEEILFLIVETEREEECNNSKKARKTETVIEEKGSQCGGEVRSG